MMAATGGNIIFCSAMWAGFKAKTVVTLRTCTLIILKPALTAAAIVLNYFAGLSAFPPEDIGKTTIGAEDLYWLAPAVRFARAHFWREKVMGITRIIQNQAILFTGKQPQASANNLLI
ncbi:hypothetical [Yersinia pestis KIM10+]|uniref:Uncharacterized protein n=1 Tax=Yersinia pestis TaxID=632 RepID=Q8CKT4_YERPE|nr:hypothetical [Yersinia pestis KIM10+]